MKQVIDQTLSDILTSIYQPFLFAILIAFLGTFLYKELRTNSFHDVIKKWFFDFKSSKDFRKIFFFVFYITIMMHKSIYNRNMWANPVSDILGGWTFHNSKGELTTECVQNAVLLFPYIILLFWNFQEKIMQKVTISNCLLVASRISLKTIIFIEAMRLIFRLGSVRIADMVYQFLGGVLGGIVYYIVFRCKNKNE